MPLQRTIYVVTVRLILEFDTCRSAAMLLSAGRYMLDDSGEKKAAKEAARMMHRFWVTLYTEYAPSVVCWSWRGSGGRFGGSSGLLESVGDSGSFSCFSMSLLFFAIVWPLGVVVEGCWSAIPLNDRRRLGDCWLHELLCDDVNAFEEIKKSLVQELD